MTKITLPFIAAAGVIAFVANATVLYLQQNISAPILAASSIMNILMAICPFVIGGELIRDRRAFRVGAICGLGATAIIWGYVVSLAILTGRHGFVDTGPVVLIMMSPFIVMSVLLVAALWRDRFSMR